MYDEHRDQLIKMGYHPVPTAPVDFQPAKCPVRWVEALGKFVKFKNWNIIPTPILTPQPGANIGIRCGNGIVALDYDQEDGAIAISDALPPTLVNKQGQRGWTAFYRVDFDAPSEDFYDSNGELVLQIISSGRQTVIPPSIHDKTLQPYKWTNGHSLFDTPASELPLLPHNYREKITALGYGVRPRPSVADTATENVVDYDSDWREINEAALKNLTAWIPELGLYKCQRQRGRYVSYRAVPDWRPSNTGKSLEQRNTNLAICSTGITDFGDGNKGYTPIDLVMTKRQCDAGEARCWLEEKLLLQKPDIRVDWEKLAETQDAPKTAPENDDNGNGDEPKEATPKRRRINPIPLILPAERDIPRRLFLFRQHYLRGTASATIGTGGTGKSTLSLTEGMGMEIGRDLTGNEKIERPFRIWYHNAEETLDELIRRTSAICKHFKIDPKQLEHFYVTNGFETPIKVAGGGRDVKIDTALRKEITEIIGDLKIDVVIFDPLVAMHRVHEDFNSALDPVIRDVFGKVAHDTNCSIDLCHHTRKKPAGQDGEYTAADSRGGQSFVDAVRGLRVLNTMSKAEAASFDKKEEERFDYMKLSRGKANMVRRGVIGWYQFVPVELDNGVPEDGISGDTVAVLDRWDPPKDSDLVRAPTDEDRQFLVGSLQYGEYRYDARSPNWFGFKIAERLGAEKKDSKQMKVVAAILDDLIDEGTLKVEEKRDEKRMLKKFVVPGILAGITNLGVPQS